MPRRHALLQLLACSCFWIVLLTLPGLIRDCHRFSTAPCDEPASHAPALGTQSLPDGSHSSLEAEVAEIQRSELTAVQDAGGVPALTSPLFTEPAPPPSLSQRTDEQARRTWLGLPMPMRPRADKLAGTALEKFIYQADTITQTFRDFNHRWWKRHREGLMGEDEFNEGRGLNEANKQMKADLDVLLKELGQ